MRLSSLLFAAFLLAIARCAAAPFTRTVLNIPDVQRGAGLAIVMQTPSGRTWLYDTGSGYPAEEGWVRVTSDGTTYSTEAEHPDAK